MKRVGPWVLAKSLGWGGNARVWAAKSDHGPGAVKVLKAKRGEPYERFRSEIEVLRRLGDRPGVLPLLDAHLPPSPTGSDPAWLAMPIATRIEDHLGPNPDLQGVVDVTRRIAHTLADLAYEGIGHRDVKPANMFWYRGEPAIGDFGLATYPGKVPVTSGRTKLGPQYYLAPEMLLDPAGADPHPADVYSLAKSLWVLATGQRYPVPGEQRLDTAAVLLSTFVEHPRAYLLDGLIDRATRVDPADRPTIATVRDELDAWLDFNDPTTEVGDIRSAASRVVSVLEAERRRSERENRPVASATKLAQAFFDRVVDVGERIDATGLSVVRAATTIFWDVIGAGGLAGHGQVLWTGAHMWLVEAGPIRLFSGPGVELYEDGTVQLGAAHIVVPGGSMNTVQVPWVEMRVTQLNAPVQTEAAIAELSAELHGHLGEALDRFADLFEASRG
jgi:hypothetical protein